MIAASYWSLLAPAIEMAAASKSYGEDGRYAFVPVSIGFAFGALFVYGSDYFITMMVCMLVDGNQLAVVLSSSFRLPFGTSIL